MESRKKNGSSYWFAFILPLVLFSCTGKELNQAYKGNYTTETIRAMWHTCYLTHRKTQPEAPEGFHWKVCDCVVDKGRSEYGSEDYPDHEHKDVVAFFTKANLECSLEVRGLESSDNSSKKVPQMRTL